MNEYVNELESLLQDIDYFVDYSLTYKLDEDAGTLKIWINTTFQGGIIFSGFEFLVSTLDYPMKNK